MENFYNIYKNIKLLITKYRKYDIVDKFCDYNDFKKNIQNTNYIMNKCINPINQQTVYTYLLNENSDIIKTTA